MTLAAVAAAVVFGWPEGVDARRVVDDVARLQAEVDAPKAATLLGRAVPASEFAARAAAGGWRPVAIHDQRVHRRDLVTVVWERGGRRVVHSRLSGEPLERPDGSGRVGRAGVLLYGIEGDLRNVVSWTAGDATAVASAAELPLGELYDLAGGPAGPRGRR